jgi:MinD-like ATPase involved in chromosome partitioning or flagellar assembly
MAPTQPIEIYRPAEHPPPPEPRQPPAQWASPQWAAQRPPQAAPPPVPLEAPPAPPPAAAEPAPPVYRADAHAPTEAAPPVTQDWNPDAWMPTAEEFAQRRAVRPPEPVATMGVRGALRKSTLGLVRPAPGRREQEYRHHVEMVRRNFGGLRQVTVVNPKGGAGKTVAVLLLAMTFGQKRGGYVLAWDNNETQGTLGMRAQQDFHSRTVRDLLRDLDHFQGSHGRVGDLSQYVRAQGEGMFDVLASDESATAGEMLTAIAFSDLREIVSRFYKLIIVDTGNNVRAQNWQAAIDATDQLVLTMSARNDSAETAARMLDHLEQQGRHRLVRQAVTVVSMPPSRRDLDIPAITRHFAARTRLVLMAPYERLIDTGEPIRYAALSSASRGAWLKIAAAVAEGL